LPPGHSDKAVGHSDKLAAFVLSARRLVATETSCLRVRLAYVGSWRAERCRPAARSSASVKPIFYSSIY